MIKKYKCPHCKKTQDDVWVSEGYYFNKRSESGYYEVKCPNCECEFDPDFAQKIGAFG